MSGRCDGGNRLEGWYGTARLGLTAERCPVVANAAPGRGRRSVLGTETACGWLRLTSAQTVSSKLRELTTAGLLTDIIVEWMRCVRPVRRPTDVFAFLARAVAGTDEARRANTN